MVSALMGTERTTFFDLDVKEGNEYYYKAWAVYDSNPSSPLSSLIPSDFSRTAFVFIPQSGASAPEDRSGSPPIPVAGSSGRSWCSISVNPNNEHPSERSSILLFLSILLIITTRSARKGAIGLFFVFLLLPEQELSADENRREWPFRAGEPATLFPGGNSVIKYTAVNAPFTAPGGEMKNYLVIIYAGGDGNSGRLFALKIDPDNGRLQNDWDGDGIADTTPEGNLTIPDSEVDLDNPSFKAIVDPEGIIYLIFLRTAPNLAASFSIRTLSAQGLSGPEWRKDIPLGDAAPSIYDAIVMDGPNGGPRTTAGRDPNIRTHGRFCYIVYATSFDTLAITTAKLVENISVFDASPVAITPPDGILNSVRLNSSRTVSQKNTFYLTYSFSDSGEGSTGLRLIRIDEDGNVIAPWGEGMEITGNLAISEGHEGFTPVSSIDPLSVLNRESFYAVIYSEESANGRYFIRKSGYFEDGTVVSRQGPITIDVEGSSSPGFSAIVDRVLDEEEKGIGVTVCHMSRGSWLATGTYVNFITRTLTTRYRTLVTSSNNVAIPPIGRLTSVEIGSVTSDAIALSWADGNIMYFSIIGWDGAMILPAVLTASDTTAKHQLFLTEHNSEEYIHLWANENEIKGAMVNSYGEIGGSIPEVESASAELILTDSNEIKRRAISLTWDYDAGVVSTLDYFLVTREENSPQGAVTREYQTETNRLTDTDIFDATEYEYGIQAVRGGVKSEPVFVKETTQEIIPPVIQSASPGVISVLSGTQPATIVTVTAFNRPPETMAQTRLILERGIEQQGQETFGQVFSTVLRGDTITIQDPVEPGETYLYRAQFVSTEGGESEYSETASVNTTGSGVPFPPSKPQTPPLHNTSDSGGGGCQLSVNPHTELRAAETIIIALVLLCALSGSWSRNPPTA